MERSLFIAPSSLDPLPDGIRIGMVALGGCGFLSLMSTVSFFLFFTHRMIYWRRFSSHPVARIQVFMLLYNLFIADIIQASSFVMSFWWISQNRLIGPNAICDTQGLLIQIGDVASGLWALAIALHTFVNIVGKKTISHRVFTSLVISLWIFVLVLATIGPIQVSHDLFIPVGAWCWVSPIYDVERLYLHYLWIFISQLGSVIFYTFIFFYLRFHVPSLTNRQRNPDETTTTTTTNKSKPSSSGISKINFTVIHSAELPFMNSRSNQMYSNKYNDINNNDHFAASRTYILKSSRHMIMYTLAYITLTLPLATGRALTMAGIELSTEFFTAAGTLMACSGFVDVALYVGTRRLLVWSLHHKKSSSTSSTSTNMSSNIYDGHANSMKPLEKKDEQFLTNMDVEKARSISNHPVQVLIKETEGDNLINHHNLLSKMESQITTISITSQVSNDNEEMKTRS